MSLLLDALKRAEQEKQLSRGGAEREPTIGPRAANAPSAASLELQPLATPAAPGSPQARNEAAAHAAQAVFQAKRPVAGEPANHRGMIFAVIAAVVLVAGAAGFYVWNQLRQLTTPTPVAYNGKRPPPAPTPEPASVATHREVPLATERPPYPTSELAGNAPVPPLEAAPPAAREQALITQALQDHAAAPPREAAPPVQLARSDAAPRIAPEVSRGYQALRNGDLVAARQAYQAALATDPRNLDALLGVATAEARGGNRPAAAGHYRQALQVDPRNATALAALAALADAQPPDRIESQIQQDLARAPGNAALHFALGNLYAGQARWNEAQAAYFESLRLDPSSPDTCFNLAVALDHLGKGRLAARYYRQALEAARDQAAQFDPDAASRRAAELEAER